MLTANKTCHRDNKNIAQCVDIFIDDFKNYREIQIIKYYSHICL